MRILSKIDMIDSEISFRQVAIVVSIDSAIEIKRKFIKEANNEKVVWIIYGSYVVVTVDCSFHILDSYIPLRKFAEM